MKFVVRRRKSKKKELIDEHERLVHVLETKDHEDDKREAKIQRKELKELKKAYKGPVTMADINLASWNSFFREGGELNQPSFLQTNRLKEIKKRYTLLAKLNS